MQADALEHLRDAVEFRVKLERRRRQLARAAADAERLAAYRDDPARYAREVLKINWWSMQLRIAESIRTHRRTVVYAGHAVGKTHGMGGIVQWHFDCFDPSITLTTAPNWSSIHDLLWGEIKAQRPPGAPGRLLDLRLDGAPMHYVAGHNAETSSGFQGRHESRVLIVLDEAMGIPPFIWEATDAMMTSPDCRVIALGNPTEASGQYYDIREDPVWNVITVSCLEHPNIAAELAGLPPPYPKAVGLVWVREMVAKHASPTQEPTADSFEWPPGSGKWFNPDDIFRPRVLGLFPRQSSQAIWSEAWLQRARTAGLRWRAGDVPEIGCDVARYGDDTTSLYGRRGPVVTNRENYVKQGTMETVGRCVALANKLGRQAGVSPKDIPVKVDDTGLDGGVTDRLCELGYSVTGINFGDRAHDTDEYFNRGAEMWFVVANLARDERLDLSGLDEVVFRRLSAELRARRYKIQSDRTLRVESKDEIRKRIGRSPDDADALVLAFAPPAAWVSLDISGRSEGVSPLIQQIRDAVPALAKKAEEAEYEYPPICGNCINRLKKGDKWYCKTRLFEIDLTSPGCDFHEMEVDDSMGTGGWSGGSE